MFYYVVTDNVGPQEIKPTIYTTLANIRINIFGYVTYSINLYLFTLYNMYVFIKFIMHYDN